MNEHEDRENVAPVDQHSDMTRSVSDNIASSNFIFRVC